ncbi:type II secretion system F family protein [bacterium]|nr:type II secretion system F family protein [bacterium]
MPIYKAIVKNTAGYNVQIERPASSRKALMEALRAEGLFPLSIDEPGAGTADSLARSSGRSKKPRRRQVLMFMKNLARLLKAGMDLERALATLAREDNGTAALPVERIAERVRHGDSLSVAMESLDVFTPFQINIIRAGEFGGNLDAALQRIASAIERELELRSKVIQATAYPLFLICFGLLSLLIMMIFIMPRFFKVYDEMHVRLPMLTHIVLTASSILHANAFWLVPMVGFAGFFGIRQLLHLSENESLDRLRFKLPLFGPLMFQMQILNFLRTLGLLVQSGIPVAQSLALLTKIAGSAVFSKIANEIEQGIRNGSRLSQELRRSNLFGESIVNLVAVGEESGHLESMLIEISCDLERRIDELIKNVLTFLEPILILAVGAIIGLIVMSMLLPIFSLSANLRAGG